MATKPRVRFAPSPTGYLHIGGVRTALFNWLYARQTGGTFILRIEDTDRERSTPENEAIILRDLRWLGLEWDEGPEKGGPNGPYRQMERLPIYAEHVEKLVRAKAAYRCVCTKEDLDAQRAALQAKDPKAKFRYPGTCRDKNVGPDVKAVVRMRAPEGGAVTYTDLVFGEVTTPNSTQQDAVIMRADGVPLYNLGAVVDDVTMGITLVARGRDHMINTPIQILLYQALGYEVPKFAHLPMMLNAKGEKLSKRDGAVAVGDYKESGIPAAGLLNYLVRFGWSHGDQEIFSMAELVRAFNWEACGRGDGKFDAKKLAATVFAHLKSDELTTPSAYLEAAKPFLEKKTGVTVDAALEATLLGALPLVRERAQTFVEAADWLEFLVHMPRFDDKAKAKFLVPAAAPMLRALAELLGREGLLEAERTAETPAALEHAIGAWLAEKGYELKVVAQAARVALVGRSTSPPFFDVLAHLGPRAIERLEQGAAAAESAAAPS